MARIKTKKAKKKSFAVTLTERDSEILTRYAKSVRCSRPIALRRIVKAFLKNFDASHTALQPKNQLSLFDVSHQINLLDVIDDVKNSK